MKGQQQRSSGFGLLVGIISALILLVGAVPSYAGSDGRIIPYPPFNVLQVLTDPKDALIHDYNSLKGKYLQQRDLADCLLQPLVGSTDWRDHLKFGEQVGKYNAAVCRVYSKFIPNITPELFDFLWNHMDMTTYLGWSVYHVGLEWLTPPDENGTGAFNIGWQDVPAQVEARFGKLLPAWASWDSAAPHIAFPLEYDYAMLMRFWAYDQVQKQFNLSGEGILIEWEAAPGGGVNTRTKILGLGAPGCTQFVEGNQSVEAPHEFEEISSWGYASQELARRKSFDPSTYIPVFKVSGVKHRFHNPHLDSDPGNVKVFSDHELQKMGIGAIQRAYDALWQKYLSQKTTADYLLHYYADHPEYVRPDCSQIYLNYFIPQP